MKTETSDLPEVSDISWMFDPIPNHELARTIDGQEVWATIGCPGSGKSTLSQTLDPNKWIVLTLDDWRTGLWPPHRRVYWDVRSGPRSADAQRTLHEVQIGAINAGLRNGWNLFLADTHIHPKAFWQYVQQVRLHGLRIKWKLFDVPKETILERNKTRPVEHRLPDEILLRMYNEMWSEDVWWRKIPKDQIEVVKL